MYLFNNFFILKISHEHIYILLDKFFDIAYNVSKPFKNSKTSFSSFFQFRPKIAFPQSWFLSSNNLGQTTAFSYGTCWTITREFVCKCVWERELKNVSEYVGGENLCTSLKNLKQWIIRGIFSLKNSNSNPMFLLQFVS